MLGNPTFIAGIPLPSDAPLFLTFIAIHVAAGLVCAIAGLLAMLSRKARGHHPSAGTVYYWSLCVVFATMTVIAVFRWAEDYHLFVLGAFQSRPRRSAGWQGVAFGAHGRAFT